MIAKMNVPELRFAEFSGEWEEKKLGTVLSFKNGINADKEQYGNGYKFINVLDIINNTTIRFENIIGSVNISKEIFEKNKVEYGNILFQRSSETREDSGQSNVYLDKNLPATFGGFVIRGQQKIEYKPEFMNYMFKTQHARKEISQKSNGSTRYNVGQDTLSKVMIYLPSKPEQEKIASFLSSVDAKIEQLSKKKKLLEEYKKGAMQKIFSLEMRFKDENGSEYPEWIEKKLGEISKINPKMSNIPESFVYIDLESVKNGTLLKSNQIFKLDAPSRAQRLLNKNDILFQMVRPYQKNNYFFNLNGRYVASTGYAQIRANESSKYLYQLLHTNKFVNNVLTRCTGTSYPAINSSDLSSIKIKIPKSSKEQTKIANFLSSIDAKIELSTKELDATKEFKKALLQKMFV